MEAIREDEGLWRDVYRERQKRALDRPIEQRVVSRTTKAVFGSTQGPDARVSTNLYDRVSLAYATAQGDLRAENVEGSHGVQGWLVIPVREASRNRRRVRHSRRDDNPYHAEILLPDEHAQNWEDAEVHLRAFLTTSTWQDRFSPLP